MRERTLNDRPAALEAKYDPNDPEQASDYGVPPEAASFLTNFTKKLQDSRGLKPGDRSMLGKVGREINSSERVNNYM